MVFEEVDRGGETVGRRPVRWRRTGAERRTGGSLGDDAVVATWGANLNRPPLAGSALLFHRVGATVCIASSAFRARIIHLINRERSVKREKPFPPDSSGIRKTILKRGTVPETRDPRSRGREAGAASEERTSTRSRERKHHSRIIDV